MLDVLATLEQTKFLRKKDFISIVDLLDFIQSTNTTANFAEIVDFLFLTLRESNYATTSLNINSAKFIDYDITVYEMPSTIYEYPKVLSINFFDVIQRVKDRFLFYRQEGFYCYLFDDEQLNEKKSTNFIEYDHQDVFISRNQIEKLLGITIPVDEKEIKEYQQQREFYLVGELSKLRENYSDNVMDFINHKQKELQQLDIDNTTNQIIKLQEQNAELQARIAELEQENQNLKNANKEYDGDIPLKTDKDKLAHTFKLIIQQSKFIEMNDGKYPTYSQLHTMINRIYPNEPTPAKNTLKKYLEP